jgi:hypothetical protein
MKKLLKFAILILTAGNMFFVACKKEKAFTTGVINPPPSPPYLKPDTSFDSKEIIFKDLIWDFDNDGGGVLYLGIENRADLFGNKAVVAVYLQADHDTTWFTAEIFHYPNSPGYVYSVYANSLFVFPSPHIFFWSDYNHLAGTKVSIKVKLL